MSQILTFEEWKIEKSISISDIARDLKDLGCSVEETEKLIDDVLKDEYKFYLYRMKNPNWFELLKNENTENPQIRDDLKSIVDAEISIQIP